MAILLAAVVMSIRGGTRDTIVLPDDTASAEPESPPVEASEPFLTVDRENVQEILATMARPSAYAQSLEGTATDQGIQVRALSALADSTTVKVYAEITDLESDRLANASIHGWVNIESDADSSIVSLSGSLLSYDPQAKTALMVFSRSGSGGLTDQTSAVLEITGIQPEYYSFETDPIPVEAITSELLATQVLSTGETVLVPGQNPLELGNGRGVSLSSAGFAADGGCTSCSACPTGNTWNLF